MSGIVNETCKALYLKLKDEFSPLNIFIVHYLRNIPISTMHPCSTQQFGMKCEKSSLD